MKKIVCNIILSIVTFVAYFPAFMFSIFNWFIGVSEYIFCESVDVLPAFVFVVSVIIFLVSTFYLLYKQFNSLSHSHFLLASSP